ncbi:MAG: hypothetical protein ACLU84_07630 [Clostridia bacterium]
MYKKITEKEKITRKITDVHSADNYLTKETTENISLAINRLNGRLELLKTVNERVFYFINANVDFIIDGEKVHLEDRDVLYLSKDTSYSAIGVFEAIVINSPAFGVIKE